MDQSVLEIAGVPVAIHGYGCCPPFFSGFRTVRRVPETVRARWNIHSHPVPQRFVTVPPARNAFDRWDHLSCRDGRLFRLRRSSADPSIWKAALMRDGYHRGDIWVNGRDPAQADPLFFLDLLLWAHLLIGYEALIIHAAAVKYQGRAFLFPGLSGSGKSTWSKLASNRNNCEVLGEDKVILRKKGAGFEVYGSPWNPRRRYRSPRSGPLGGIFFLEHSSVNRFYRCPPPSAFPRLLQAAFLPFVRKDEYIRAAAILERSVAEVPVRRFGFLPSTAAVDFWISVGAD